jgi:hypothetical protein
MRNRPILATTLVGTMVLGLLALGPAASAKCVPGAPACPMVEVAYGTLEGPDLQGGVPIIFDDDDFWTVARRAGLGTYRPRGGSFSEPPPLATMGPKYRLDLRVRLSNGDRFAATLDVYPYVRSTLVDGSVTAWVRIPTGLRFIETLEGGFFEGTLSAEPGWYRSTSLHQTLVDLGLPETSPAQDRTSAGASAERAGDEGSTTATWALLAALLALLVGGALLGRARAATDTSRTIEVPGRSADGASTAAPRTSRLSRAPCARGRWCSRGSTAWCSAPPTRRPASPGRSATSSRTAG